ncbi:hypothetical protein BDR06DRAFT_1012664 [Suillus hirtellus]|nr:hypothetical protein BDR06DRAFT_1012664 [Suillus hirtellus]
MSSQCHFLETFPGYLYAVVAEAFDRRQEHRRSLDDYLKLWCKSAGVIPCISIWGIGIDLPDEVFYHPFIMDLAGCITDLVLIDNDMISYNKEQAVGEEAHNIISAIMFDLGLDVGGAMAWAVHYHTEVQK